MRPIDPEEFLTFWYEALRHEFGLCIPTTADDIKTIEARLYDARKDVSDPRIAGLSLHCKADGSAIYIFKQGKTELK